MTIQEASRIVRLFNLAKSRGDRATCLILQSRVIDLYARYGATILGLVR